jgi:hypothetical protein
MSKAHLKQFTIVMRGFDPRIHALFQAPEDVDGRDKPGQDDYILFISI